MKILFIVLALVVAVHPQTRRPQRRATLPKPSVSSSESKAFPVKVKLQSGKVVIGRFLSANDHSLTLTTDEGSQEIQLSTVVEIQFDSAAPSLNDESARAAIKALRKLDSAVSVGLTYSEYGKRLVDTKVSVDEAMDGMPDGEVRKQLTLAMNDYQIASGVWEEKMSGRSFLDPDSGYYQSLLKAYPNLLTTGTTDNSGRQLHVGVDEILRVIWDAARSRLEKAAHLLQ